MSPKSWESRAKSTLLRIDQLDQELLDRSFQEALNQIRKKRGLPQLEHSNNLDLTATGYAREMASFDFFGHVHPHNMSLRTALDRIKARWPEVQYTGENLAEFSPYRISKMKAKYFIQENDDGTYDWLDSQKKPLELHTYYSFAEFVTDKWMGSKGHRQNLLSPNYEYLGMGYALDQSQFPNEIPMVYVVQNFASP